ncbi:MAG TPA: PKD domain-containing protein [Bacteroidia bacterium]|jgi:hypothetical protein|nr:PKD domain-containing protein [Bacteroidia bacterium]
MKRLILTFGLVAGFIFFAGCTKSKTTNPANANSTTPLAFSSLKASVNPVQQSQVSNITATASGNNISYTWTASHGDLFGSGAAVMYSTAPCCVGTHTITCVVSDGSSSQTKTLVMTVTN